jgi:hypothetical protein
VKDGHLGLVSPPKGDVPDVFRKPVWDAQRLKRLKSIGRAKQLCGSRERVEGAVLPEDPEIGGAEKGLLDREGETVTRFRDPRSLNLSAVRLVTGAAVKIEPDRLRRTVDINLWRGDVVDEITARQIEDVVLVGAPWTLGSIRDRELDIAAYGARSRGNNARADW